MQRFFIQGANFALLALLLIGVPAVAHAQMGDWQITPASTLHRLIFGGLLIALVGNGAAAAFLIKSRKERIYAGNGRRFSADCWRFNSPSPTDILILPG